MKLYVEQMDTFVVEVDGHGRVRYAAAGDHSAVTEADEKWSYPTLQERRAIIFAARGELAALQELVDALEGQPSA